MEEILFNMVAVEVQEVEIEGRTHLKVPAVGITEGVHPGTKGKVLYLSEEGEKDPQAWDHKPVIAFHPKESTKDGRVTASNEVVLNKQKVGFPMNTRWEDGKLKMDVYLDKNRLSEVDGRILEAINNRQKVEVSTGLRASVDWTPGVWNGQEYDGIARNWRPDHLAILPEGKGACSVDKGAGLLQNQHTEKPIEVENELSLDERSMLVRRALYDKFSKPGYSWDGWVSDVYADFCIYYMGGDFYQQAYKVNSKDEVGLKGAPTKVMRKTVYENIENGLKLCEATKPHLTPEEIASMNKKAKIQAILAANLGFTEVELENMDEALLDKFVKVKKPVEVENKETPTPAPAPTPTPTPTPKPTNLDDYLKDLPAPVAAVVRRSMTENTTICNNLVEKITAHPKNQFKKEYLLSKDRDELEAIAALLPEETVENEDSRFGGFNRAYVGTRFIGPGGATKKKVEELENSEGSLSSYDFDDETVANSTESA